MEVQRVFRQRNLLRNGLNGGGCNQQGGSEHEEFHRGISIAFSNLTLTFLTESGNCRFMQSAPLASSPHSPRPLSVMLQRQRQHHDQSFDLLSRALDNEQSGRLSAALELYRQGRDELQHALALRFQPDEWEHARVLDGKMRKNLVHVEERIKSINSTFPSTVDSDRPGSKVLFSSLFGANNKRKLSTDVSNNQSSAAPLTSAAVGRQQKSNPLQGVDRELAHRILDQVLEPSSASSASQGDQNHKPGATAAVQWDDIVGLDEAKRCLQETVILPSLRPDLYTGLRSPVRGILLYGPPGTGKTMLAKAVAGAAKCRFFAISASSLTSKWLGEGEKMVRTLFQMARELQPSVIFIDELDSLLSQRQSQGEHEASRRLKTEFLVQFDGIQTNADDRLLVMAATNRPQDLDEAVIRRFPRRLYIPLPAAPVRRQLLEKLLRSNRHQLRGGDMDRLAGQTDGYSCSDLHSLAKEAALGPLRDLTPAELQSIAVDKIRPIKFTDFQQAIQRVRPSVEQRQLAAYEEWGRQFGGSMA